MQVDCATGCWLCEERGHLRTQNASASKTSIQQEAVTVDSLSNADRQEAFERWGWEPVTVGAVSWNLQAEGARRWRKW